MQSRSYGHSPYPHDLQAKSERIRSGGEPGGLFTAVQFALDHYEISNTHLIDMYLARTDRVNSIYGYGIITVLLLIQIYIMLLEASMH